MSTARRVLIVSNRLPITVRRVKGELQVSTSTGGLATGLAGVHREGGAFGSGGLGTASP